MPSRKREQETDELAKTRNQPHKNPVYYPSEIDHEIITYVKEYYLFTVWQLVNLRFAKGSKTRANTLLQILSGHHPKVVSPGFLYRDALHTKSAGNPTYYYVLSTAGINYLKQNGYPSLSRRFRPSEVDALSYPHKIHALNVNDVLIAGRNLPKYAPDIQLLGWQHDFDLSQKPAVVSVEAKQKGRGVLTERVTIDPDGMLDFRLSFANTDKTRRRIILVEVDRGTETEIDRFKRKLRAYVFYCLFDGLFEERFGKVDRRIAYIVTKGGQNRLYTLRKWCEDELMEQDMEQEYNLFRFTTLDQVVEIDKRTGEARKREELDIDPYQLFLSPVWYKPFHAEPEPLLWKPK